MRNQKKLKAQIKIGSRVLVRSTKWNYRFCVHVTEVNENSISGLYADLNQKSKLAYINTASTTRFGFPYYEILDVFEIS